MPMEMRMKTLWDMSERMKSALVHVGRISRGINGECTDPLEKVGLECEPRLLEEELPDLRDGFVGSYVLMRDNWKAIENNRVWMHEINEFSAKYREFCSAVLAFDDLLIDNEMETEDYDTLRDISVSMVMLAAEYDEKFSAVFRYAADTLPKAKPKLTPLQGICEDMKAYFSGLTDKDLEDVLIRDVYAGIKGHWIGSVTQGTYFGLHFKVPASRMNRLFTFYGENNQPTKVHYTRYPATNIRDTDHIAVILAKYPHREK